MKKALTYMLVGALTYEVINMMICKKNSFSSSMKRLKRSGMDAYNKVKSMF